MNLSYAYLKSELSTMLEGYQHPAILMTMDYRILASNQLYQEQFGPFSVDGMKYCYEVSHGYKVPCDQAGEECPLATVKQSKNKTRVLHIHQTPRGKEHVDVEVIPILDDEGNISCFIELFKPIPFVGIESKQQDMVGASQVFNKFVEKLTRVSQSMASVLLLGESGTGKELAAKAIHLSSTRKDFPLVTLECAGLTDTLFESELFGHVKGAFTGANSNKKGLVEEATNGTLFLDEIGDVPLSMQIKLLRLLETGTFRSVGSAQIKTSNFRLICATHKNLAKMVANGEFREDLYYRINVFPIMVPSLRDRLDDLDLIINHLLSRLSPDRTYYLSKEAKQRLSDYHFPGNIRELRNILNRALVLTDNNLIERNIIEDCLLIDKEIHTDEISLENDNIEWVDLKSAEKQYLTKLMQAHNQNKEQVAKIAGISLRSLYRKLGD